FFDTRDDHEFLLVRPKDTQDNATPSGNALALNALLRLVSYGDRPQYQSIVDEMVGLVLENARQYPTAYGLWLQGLNLALGPIKEVAIIGDPEDLNTQLLLKTVWSGFDPYRMVAISTYPPHEHSPELVKQRPLMEGKASAYVCQNFVCQQPVTKPADLAKQLFPKQNELHT
ncbi:MAG TPA: hypothetical protein VK856_02910, partial [Anaerolineaceae bacterium]|nr:hypothetical protein [Anaerolineaceae bacterium]